MEYTGMYRGDKMEKDYEVLCGASSYEKKFYINEAFANLPDSIKDELKIMCVVFTEDVGGIIVLEFDEEGKLLIRTEADEGDLLYDEIGAGLKVKQLQKEKEETFEALEMFYKVFFLGEEAR